MTRLNLVCGLFGVAFGGVFAAGGLNQYDVIHQMLLLRNVQPFLIMGSSVVTALPLLWLLERRGWHSPLGGAVELRRWAIERKHVGGGIIFGVGWAITGACPGTASTALGAGSLMGIPLLLGIVAGIAVKDAIDVVVDADDQERTVPEPAGGMD
jgi:uncharacterized membrane protein YedE/YeeE